MRPHCLSGIIWRHCEGLTPIRTLIGLGAGWGRVSDLYVMSFVRPAFYSSCMSSKSRGRYSSLRFTLGGLQEEKVSHQYLGQN